MFLLNFIFKQIDFYNIYKKTRILQIYLQKNILKFNLIY